MIDDVLKFEKNTNSVDTRTIIGKLGNINIRYCGHMRDHYRTDKTFEPFLAKLSQKMLAFRIPNII